MGPPLPCNNIKLEDIPDMEYWVHKSQGEVCIKGANVFLGYYRQGYLLRISELFPAQTG